jgi:hypothetical protein
MNAQSVGCVLCVHKNKPLIQQKIHLIVVIVLLEDTQSTLTTRHGLNHVKWQKKCQQW